MCAAANASELFCMAYLANDERFLYAPYQVEFFSIFFFKRVQSLFQITRSIFIIIRQKFDLCGDHFLCFLQHS